MKKSFVKKYCAAAMAACAVAFFGCSRAKPVKTYAPIAPEGTLFAAISDVAALADNPMSAFVDEFVFNMQEKLVGKLEEMGVPECEPAKIDFAAMRKRHADYGKTVAWSGCTVARPTVTLDNLRDGGEIQFPATVMLISTVKPRTMEEWKKEFIEDAFANSNEEDKAKTREFLNKNFEVSADTVAGCQVEKYTLRKTEATEDFLEGVAGCEPCWGVLDGTLMIAASSPAAFADTVALYRGEKAASTYAPLVEDFKTGGASQVRGGFYGPVAFARDLLGEDEFSEKLPFGQPGQFISATRDIRFSETADAEGMKITTEVAVSFDDEAVPPSIAQIFQGAKGFLGMMVSAKTAAIPEIASLGDVFNTLDVKAAGDTATLSFSITKENLEKTDFATLISRMVGAKCMARDDGDDGDDGEGGEDD